MPVAFWTHMPLWISLTLQWETACTSRTAQRCCWQPCCQPPRPNLGTPSHAQKNSVLGLLTPMGGGRTLGQFFLRWDLWGTEIYSSTKKNKSWCRKYGYENATELRKPWKQWKEKQSGSWTWWKVWLTQGFWRFPSVCFGENLLVCFSTMMKLIQLYFFSRFKRNCVFFEFKSQITLDSFCVYK